MSDDALRPRMGSMADLAKMKPQRVDMGAAPEWFRRAAEAKTYRRRTHTPIVLGNNQVGHVLKLICDSTGRIVQLPCGVTGRLKEPYPVCRFCGLVFATGGVVDRSGEYVVDTDLIDAWPALPWWPDA